MKSSPRYAMLSCIFALAFSVAAGAQAPTDPPVPSQFATAKTAFLSFAGAPVATDSNETIRAVYGSFYRALTADGHYKLTTAPADAELIFEFSILEREYPGLQIQIFDMKTRAVLWTITERVDPALRKNSILKNLDQTSTHLITDLNALIGGKLP